MVPAIAVENLGKCYRVDHAAADSGYRYRTLRESLMKLAARLLFRGGNRILTTDLTWPSYAKILERERTRANGSIECLRVRAEAGENEESENRSFRPWRWRDREMRCHP